MVVTMLKQVLASLLLVIISSGWCIGADEYIRTGWEVDKKVDDLTDEIISYTAYLEYNSNKLLPVRYYGLSIGCNMEKTELIVSIKGGAEDLSWLKPIVGGNSRMLEDVPVEYRFNREPVLKEVWKIIQMGNVFIFESLYPIDFARKLLRVMEGEFRFRELGQQIQKGFGGGRSGGGGNKTQFRFREVGRETLHFDLRGGASSVSYVLGKCNALPEKVE